MTQAFFNSTAGDPASLTRLLAFQTADGIPALDSALVPYKSYGGVLSPSPTNIRRQAVLTRPMRELDMRSKVDNAGKTLNLGDIDPSNHGQLALLLSLFQGYAVSTASGHSRWRISQQQAVDTARSAFDLAQQRYRAGIGSYLDVLTAQSTLLQSQQQLAGLQSQQVQTSVRLSKALGGGFQPSDADRAPIASHSDSSHS